MTWYGIVFLFFFGVFVLTNTSCTDNRDKKPELALSVYTYDLGNVEKDSLLRGVVIVTNVGADTLKINAVFPDCSCTNAWISKEVIAPKDTCSLSFEYDTTDKNGMRNNYIRLMANTDSLFHTLQVKVNVIRP